MLAALSSPSLKYAPRVVLLAILSSSYLLSDNSSAETSASNGFNCFCYIRKNRLSVKSFGKTAMAKMLLMLFLFSVVVYLLIDTVTAYRAPTEEERVQLWHEDKNVRKITNPNPITNFCHQIDISNKISHKIPSRIMFHLYYLLYHFSYHQSSLLSGMATELATRIRWNQRIVCTTRERNHGNSWWE